MIKLYVQTELSHRLDFGELSGTEQITLIEICTCVNEDSVIRSIITCYEDIWQNTLNRPVDTPAKEYGSSTDPIILNWGGSEIVVEDMKTGDRNYYYL